ncbi:HAD family hydrolase [Caloranaerobacter azorensis H53214]|uniref:HAD family hydrolase n=1 Tax=Caloranaerobacter azorensis H53214 TaxID=1156417 RepID=A0A096BH45_9FIRM|nr:HAD family hydrolase [Caloranaerobacter azorensis]KGG80048.1 HAD family hydrolase [Caloranaerobacter azorensis H53214]
MNYKLLAIDLDGTLLTDDKRILKENKEVLAILAQKGLEIIIATGRRYWSAKNFAKELGIELTILANNGNIVRRISDDKVLIANYLDREDFNRVVKKGREIGLYPILHVDHYEEGYDLLIEEDEEGIKYSNYVKKNVIRHKKIKNILDYEESKILVICYENSYETLREFEEKIHKEYPQKFNTHILMNGLDVEPMLEIMSLKGSKWLSLKNYAKDRGIDESQIIAIGDDNNDVEMVEKAGLGIAMKNGTDKIKNAADIITKKTNNEAGVSQILKEIFRI